MSYASCNDAPEGGAVPPRLDRRDLVICAGLLLLATVVLGKGMTIGGPRWGDVGTHVMDGVLIYDWVCAGPTAWVDPLGFAERQFGHYPTLGIVGTYPPGFATVEACFFAVFGVSVVTARLCVLSFALALAGGVFVLVRRFSGRLSAACAVLGLLAMPNVVLWSRQAMLEAPTLAVLVWSAVAVCHYREHPCWRRLVCWVFLTVTAVMFKQTAAFILAPYGVLLVVWTIRRRSPWSHLVAAAVVSLGTVGGYALLISSGGKSMPLVLEVIACGRSPLEMLSVESWLAYLHWLPDQTGWVVLALGALGLVLTRRRHGMLGTLMVLWFISVYAQFSLIQHKEPRYFFFGLLPIAVFAGAAAGTLVATLRRHRLRLTAVATLAALAGAFGYAQPIPYRPDYGTLVMAHRDRIVGQVVLFDGQRDSDFILSVRQHLGRRKCVILRASKLLYACASVPGYRFQSFTESRDQVDATLRDFAFDSVFVERHPRMKLAEEKLLRESLDASGDYTLAASHTLRAGPGILSSPATEVDVDVYLPRHPMARRTESYQIPVLMDNRVISVNLDDLLTDSG